MWFIGDCPSYKNVEKCMQLSCDEISRSLALQGLRANYKGSNLTGPQPHSLLMNCFRQVKIGVITKPPSPTVT